MLNLPAILDSALARHRAGDAGALSGYAAVLTAAPAHADAVHLLGLALLQQGETAAGLAWATRAVRLDGSQAIFRNTRGEGLRLSGCPAEAAVEFQAACRLDPAYPDAYTNLLKVAADDGTGTAWRRYLLAARPGADDLAALAEVLLLSGRPGRAAAAGHAGVVDAPDAAAPWLALGAALSRLQRRADAAQAFRRAALLQPELAAAWNNLASMLWELNDADGAVAACRRAIALQPGHPDAYSNLGHVERCQALVAADHDAAERQIRRALRLEPGHVPSLNNLGILHLDRGRLAAAEAAFREVLWVQPDHADARFNLSLALLQGGRLPEGWAYYEARWDTGQLPRPQLGVPLWQGEPLRGRRVLLHAEQGQGDTIHFVRYAPLVAQRGGRVVLAVQPALTRLLAGLPGVEAVHALGEPVAGGIDCWCPLLSLPRLFSTSLATIPAAVPYLAVPGDRAATDLGGAGLKVGLVWSGDPRPDVLRAALIDRRRSVPLRALAPLGAVPGIAWFSLQMGAARAQLADTPAGLALTDLMDGVADFADTAARVARLDLVITVDTAVAHLAGALGKPVWLLSRFDGCWRWMAEGTATPWYPTMRLYRQPAPGDWRTPVARMAADLQRLAGG